MSIHDTAGSYTGTLYEARETDGKQTGNRRETDGSTRTRARACDHTHATTRMAQKGHCEGTKLGFLHPLMHALPSSVCDSRPFGSRSLVFCLESLRFVSDHSWTQTRYPRAPAQAYSSVPCTCLYTRTSQAARARCEWQPFSTCPQAKIRLLGSRQRGFAFLYTPWLRVRSSSPMSIQ